MLKVLVEVFLSVSFLLGFLASVNAADPYTAPAGGSRSYGARGQVPLRSWRDWNTDGQGAQFSRAGLPEGMSMRDAWRLRSMLNTQSSLRDSRKYLLEPGQYRFRLKSKYWEGRDFLQGRGRWKDYVEKMRSRSQEGNWRGRYGSHRVKVGLFWLPERYTRHGTSDYLKAQRTMRIGRVRKRAENPGDYFHRFSPFSGRNPVYP